MSEPPPASGPNPAALRIALVGPSHPAKGGVAAHTTTLAHELADAGHDVVLVSWAQMFPKGLYPGEQQVPDGIPDVEPYARTVPVLRWSRPEGWVRTGRRLRDVDLVVLVHVVPQVVPAHLAILRAAGAGRARGPRSVAIVHNVLPHEPRPGDAPLVRLLLGAVDGVIVHSEDQAALAADLGATRIAVVPLPAHLPGGDPVARPASEGPARLLALGIVRPYKGLDLLLTALARVPGPTLTIAGEMWGDAGEEVRRLATDPRLSGRVTVLDGYVPADRLAALLADHDVLTLAYRHATASQNVQLAHHHGLAVLASDVGTFGAEVHDGVDGLLVPPGDEESLVAALERLAEPGYAARLRDGVRPPDLHGPWVTYVGALEALAVAEVAADHPPVEPAASADPGVAGRTPAGPTQGDDGVRGAVRDLTSRAKEAAATLAGRRSHVDIRRSDLPGWLRPSDLLSTDEEAADAADLARELRLPRHTDPIAGWAALGALAAVVRLRARPGQHLDVVDCSGPSSPFVAWSRATGHEPLEWGLPDPGAALDDVDVDAGSCDVLTMLHPTDCDAGDVDGLLALAAWILRRGGILSFTVAAGGADVPGAVAPGDVRSIVARADSRGLVLVGDIDSDVTERLRGASLRGAGLDAAYGVVRLTFRRR